MATASDSARARPPRKRPAILGGEPAFADFVYFTRPRPPDAARFSDLAGGIFETRQFTNDGRLVRELQERLAERLGVEWCAAVCNGTTALQLALRALGLEGAVVTTPFTFPATVHAIEWSGLEPVFCDVDPETWNLDPEAAAAAITERTGALLPVHVFGNPCDVVALERLASRRGLRLVYDAAHAFGVSARGRSVGTWGDLSALSFHATKLFHTAEGGAVVGRDPLLLERVAALRNFAIRDEAEMPGVGINGKMSELHAALGLALLDGLDGEIEARARIRERYLEWFRGVEGIVPQRIAPRTSPNHAYFAIEIDPAGFGLTRDQVRQALLVENVVARRYFWPLCSENPAYRALPSAAPERLPNAHRIAARTLCLPLYGDLGLDAADRIAGALLALRDAAPRVRARLGGGASIEQRTRG